MKSYPRRVRLRIPIAFGFPASLVVGLGQLEGTDVADARDGGHLATVENVSIEHHQNNGPAFLQVGLMARRGYDIQNEKRSFRMRIKYIDPTGDARDPQKWRISAIELADE